MRRRPAHSTSTAVQWCYEVGIEERYHVSHIKYYYNINLLYCQITIRIIPIGVGCLWAAKVTKSLGSIQPQCAWIVKGFNTSGAAAWAHTEGLPCTLGCCSF